MQDISAGTTSVNLLGLITLCMTGIGLQNHTANAGIIYGLVNISGFLGVICSDSIGGYLFELKPDYPIMALALPSSVLLLVCITITLTCFK